MHQMKSFLCVAETLLRKKATLRAFVMSKVHHTLTTRVYGALNEIFLVRGNSNTKKDGDFEKRL